MACSCGYEGNEFKMAFDADEAYKYLCENGLVYTIRPVFGASAVIRARVHLHRAHKWTQQIAEKQLIKEGKGGETLLLAVSTLNVVPQSGFLSQRAWLDKLSSMHGKHLTTFRWAIYLVKLIHTGV